MTTPYGNLTVICGPMYAGKTTEILKRVLWARNGEGKNVLVLKPSMDSRYSETEIVSHDGLKAVAMSVVNLPEVDGSGGLIVLDEVQFFNPALEVVQWVRQRLEEGYDVVAAGLDMDWRGSPFEVTANLICMADNVVKITANCTVCGRAASKTYKKNQAGGPVEIGAQDKYEARCNRHWNRIAPSIILDFSDPVAEAAVARMKARADEDLTEWAHDMAKQVVEGGIEYDKKFKRRPL